MAYDSYNLVREMADGIAKKAVARIMKNLKESTFYDEFPDAHCDLSSYKLDMAEDIKEEIVVGIRKLADDVASSL